MRKALSFTVAFGLMSSVFALDMSIGGCGFLGSNFGGGIKIDLSDGTNAKVTMPYNGGGINIFFDAKYVDVSVGSMFAVQKMKNVVTDGKDYSEKIDLVEGLFLTLNLGLLVKYPISLSETMKLFPAAGIDYESRISDHNEKMNRLWIKFGTGADFDLSKKMYLRSTLLYGIGLKNKYEDDFCNSEVFIDQVGIWGEPSVILSHGLTAKVGIGFKL